MAKVLAARKDSAEQNGGIDGGNLGIPNSFSTVNVGKVVEEPSVVRQLLPQEPERDKHAFEGIAARNQSALLSDAESRQTETGGGDAGYDPLIIRADVAPIFHHPCLVAGLLPEIAEVRDFQLVQKPVVFGRQRREAGQRRWPLRRLLYHLLLARRLLAHGQDRNDSCQGQASPGAQHLAHHVPAGKQIGPHSRAAVNLRRSRLLEGLTEGLRARDARLPLCSASS